MAKRHSLNPSFRQKREKRLDKLVKKAMRVGLVVGDDGRLVRFVR